MKRVFIIHGWGGFPEEAWFPWLKQQLERKGFQVSVPSMPETENPKIETWVPFLTQQVGQPDTETYLVGHSIGVQAILRYVQTLNQPIGGILAVAGFFKLIPGSLQPEEEPIAQPWQTIPIDTEKVKEHALKISAIFSDNDPFVGLENQVLFGERLKAKTLVLPDKGHMGSSDGFKEIPEILIEFLELTK